MMIGMLWNRKGYKFVWTTTKGIMEFRPIATIDTFTPDLSEDYLKFFGYV